MKTRSRRFGIAVAAAVALAAALIVPGTDKAWSMEQTLAAMKEIETLHITGTNLCHRRLGDNAQAIESYQKALREFPTGWEGVVQFYLGVAYLHNGQPQEALQAFQACLADAEGKRGPDQFPVKDVHEYMARIKGQ